MGRYCEQGIWDFGLSFGNYKNTHLLHNNYHSVVDKVDDDLEDAAEACGQGDPQVDLIRSGIGDVFLRFCPEESFQEVVSGVDLVH